MNSHDSTMGAGTHPLLRHWVHSHEEDLRDTQVFRPSNFDFPPSRGRRAFDIRGDGTLTFYDIAPADGLAKVEGAWIEDSDGTIVIRFEGSKRSGYKLHIRELSADRLVVDRFF